VIGSVKFYMTNHSTSLRRKKTRYLLISLFAVGFWDASGWINAFEARGRYKIHGLSVKREGKIPPGKPGCVDLGESNTQTDIKETGYVDVSWIYLAQLRIRLRVHFM
jgi:hypothetical protein